MKTYVLVRDGKPYLVYSADRRQDGDILIDVDELQVITNGGVGFENIPELLPDLPNQPAEYVKAYGGITHCKPVTFLVGGEEVVA